MNIYICVCMYVWWVLGLTNNLSR